MLNLVFVDIGHVILSMTGKIEYHTTNFHRGIATLGRNNKVIAFSRQTQTLHGVALETVR